MSTTDKLLANADAYAAGFVYDVSTGALREVS
jgi:hypothetical protein